MQAHAWMALGKVCLVNEQLAKRCILDFVRELHAARATAVSHPSPTQQTHSWFTLLLSSASCMGNWKATSVINAFSGMQYLCATAPPYI